jgi:hypothetical protein
LLFLRFLPATDAFTVSDVECSAQFINGRTKALTEGPLPQQLQSGKDAQSFINEVTGAIAASGTEAKEEQP